MSSQLIGTLIGSYRIIDSLGQGGMATVYRAYHARLDRYVAIKMMHPAFREDPGFMTRFQREAQIVARLEHPNIVPVYDYSDYQGQPYLVMKYIEGQTLKAQVRGGQLPLVETARILTAISSALTYAHRMDVLHRDIKPSNILMEHGSVPYLADFGLARLAAIGESTLSQDMILGTPQYMSPEQAQGIRDLDARADIYSLGIVLYEMLTGQVPFNADSAYTIIHDHINAPLPLPSTINPQLPLGLDRVLSKALAKDRADRYDSAIALAAAFVQVLQEAGLSDLLQASLFPANETPFPPPSLTGSTPPRTTPPIMAGYSDSPRLRMPVTPTFDPTSAYATPKTLALDPTPAVRAFDSSNAALAMDTAGRPLSTSAARSRRLHHLHRRRNLWVAGGFSGLLLTLLIGLFVVVGAANDRALQLAFARPPGIPGGGSGSLVPLPSLSLPPGGAGGIASASVPVSTTISSPVLTATTYSTATSTTTPSLNLKPISTRSSTIIADQTAAPITAIAIPVLSVAEAQAQLAVSPNDPVVLFALALSEIKGRQPIIAQQHFDQAVSAVGNNVPVLAGALNAYTMIKPAGHAIFLAEKLLTIGALPPDLYANATRLLYFATDTVNAGDVRAASKLLPEMPEIDALTALVLDRNGQSAEADAQLKRAISLAPAAPLVLLARARIEQARGLNTQAAQDYQAAFDADNVPMWIVNQATLSLHTLTSTPPSPSASPSPTATP